MSANAKRPLDDASRRAIREDLASSYVVEAAAGTGKTTELVARIVAVLAAGVATIDRIVAVTFTEKAAGELKFRLRKELEGARLGATGAAQANLEDALKYLEEARVNTIHGFCADLLRERPVEAGVDPLFQVLTEDQAARLYDVAFNAWLQDQLREPGEGVRRSLRRVARRNFGADVDEDGPIERLRRAGRGLLDWRDHPARWRRDPFDRATEIARMLDRLKDFVDAIDGPSWDRDTLYLDTVGARTRWASVASGLVPPHDLDGLEALLVDLHHDRNFVRPRKGSGAAYSKRHTRADIWDRRQQLYDALGEFERRANADLAAVLQQDLQDSLTRYQRLKAADGALDFVDLLLSARALIRDNADVRRTFRERLTHLFVDEFQDTDPLQAEILILLSGAPDADVVSPVRWQDVRPRPGSLFIVGDPKQSIYRFRRADVGTYRAVCEWLEQRGARAVKLSTSFRATPGIQRMVNAAFAPLMTGDALTLQPEYVQLDPWRDAVTDRPSVVCLPVPRPYGARGVAKHAIERSLPDAVGAFLHWLFEESGWTIVERRREGDAPVPVKIAARHVCLLFRRFTSFNEDVTRPYVEALEARDIPHLLVGGKSFHDREEVESIRAALTAIEWPDDELSVFATLRGALIALGDEVLLEYRHHFGRFHPYQVPEHLVDRLAPVGQALALLRSLHQRRNSRPVADTIGELLSATRAHVAFALRPGGEQALANVLHIGDLARRYEAEGGLSFRGFVDRLGEAAERSEAPEAPILEDGSEGVRLMTVHKAKGLEFPVVVLVDMTCKLSRDTADRYVDPDAGMCAVRLAGWAPADLVDHEPLEVARDREEAHRVAYVAATRARDLLVIPAVGDAPFSDGWVSPLNGAIYPAVAERRAASAAPACPAFKRDSVLERPSNDPARADTVQPGQHRLRTDTPSAYDVVWWDPSVLGLDRRPRRGVRHETLIGKDAPRAVVQETLAAHTAWQTARDSAVGLASTPSLHVATASLWASTASADIDALHEVTVESVAEIVEGRPSGPVFGALVHAVLAHAPLDASRETIEAVTRTHARGLGASETDAAAAVDVAIRVFSHPLLARARRARDCRREVPLMLSMAGGTLVEGVADLAFVEENQWTVVDFKTDVEIGRVGLEAYKRQAGVYAAAIERATGRTARGVLLRI